MFDHTTGQKALFNPRYLGVLLKSALSLQTKLAAAGRRSAPRDLTSSGIMRIAGTGRDALDCGSDWVSTGAESTSPFVMPSGFNQRRLAAIMFTDMVGYSALTHRNEALAMELLEEHRRILREAFSQFQGREVETMGDGFLVEFASAVEAVRCGLEVQRRLAARNGAVDECRRIQVRIGVHVGDIVLQGDQVMGDGVNIAARLEPLAKAGGVCISNAVFEQVHNKLPEVFVSLGLVSLKNVGRPVEVYSVEVDAGQVEARDGPAQGQRAGSGEQSIAVLPFVNMSDDRENEFLSDGITEDLITRLSQVNNLRVPARTSAFAFKGKNEDIRKIGQVLNVQHVLEGSVRKAGQRLRITAQLISVADGYHLWSQRFDREMADVFVIQDEIARAIVDALKIELAGADPRRQRKAPTHSTEAYQLYLRGRTALYERGSALQKAYHYFELAVLEDPSYGLAYSGLADAHFLLSFFGFVSAAEGIPRALAASEKAVQLSPDSAEARVSLATVKGWCAWQFDTALELYRQSLQLNARYPQARAWYGSFLAAFGRHDEAIEQHQYALSLDPLSPYLNTIFGWGLMHARRFDEAIGPLQRALELAPEYPLAHWLLGRRDLSMGKLTAGIDRLIGIAEKVSRAGWVLAYLGYGLAQAGKTREASGILEELSDPAKQRHVHARFLAVVHAGLGNKDAAFQWLEKAYEERDVQLPWLNIEPAFLALQTDPRFQALQAKVGFRREIVVG